MEPCAEGSGHRLLLPCGRLWEPGASGHSHPQPLLWSLRVPRLVEVVFTVSPSAGRGSEIQFELESISLDNDEP